MTQQSIHRLPPALLVIKVYTAYNFNHNIVLYVQVTKAILEEKIFDS